jgi:hypothetical protein
MRMFVSLCLYVPRRKTSQCQPFKLPAATAQRETRSTELVSDAYPCVGLVRSHSNSMWPQAAVVNRATSFALLSHCKVDGDRRSCRACALPLTERRCHQRMITGSRPPGCVGTVTISSRGVRSIVLRLDDRSVQLEDHTYHSRNGISANAQIAL